MSKRAATHLEKTSLTDTRTDRRRHKRHKLLWSGTLRTWDGTTLDCTILDLSASGAKVRLDQPVIPGELVTLMSRRFGMRPARVAWMDGVIIGLEFLSVDSEPVLPVQ